MTRKSKVGFYVTQFREKEPSGGRAELPEVEDQTPPMKFCQRTCHVPLILSIKTCLQTDND